MDPAEDHDIALQVVRPGSGIQRTEGARRLKVLTQGGRRLEAGTKGVLAAPVWEGDMIGNYCYFCQKKESGLLQR